MEKRAINSGTEQYGKVAFRRVDVLVLAALLPASALGLIDPKHTPVELVRESTLILSGTVTAGSISDTWNFKVTECIKGQSEPQVTIVVSGCKKEDEEAIRGLVSGDNPAQAILFSAGSEEGNPAFLHVANTWLQLKAAGGGLLRVENFPKRMNGVYAGGTDMLIRMCRYIPSDPRSRVPTRVGSAWMREVTNLGMVAGEISGMEAFMWDGRVYLFVASPAGDRLFLAMKDDEAFQEVTAETELEAKSRRFAWLDLGPAGRPALISWDGEAIRLLVLAETGTFQPQKEGQALRWEEECLGLFPCRLSAGGSPAVLISRMGAPVLLLLDGKIWKAVELPGGPPGRDKTAACIVADLDHDGFWDVLQPREEGGLLWKGGASGFQESTPSAFAFPGHPGCFTLGDFNQDGFLDVFSSGPKESQLWENDGAAGFTGVIRKSGSLGYKATGGYSVCRAADLNHDGRLDLCLLHPRDGFAYHFNRGFRCFGEEGELRLHEPGGQEESSTGQKACAVADFNGDGSLDLAVAFSDGQVACYYNDTFNKPLLRVGIKARFPAPVTASLWRGKKTSLCLGAHSVPALPARIHFAVEQPGDYTLRWHFPGNRDVSRRVKLFPRPGGGPEILLGE